MTEPDYKAMYFSLFRSVTKAIDLLQNAQQECEELYLAADDESEPDANTDMMNEKNPPLRR